MRDLVEAETKTGLEIMDVAPRKSEVYEGDKCVFSGSSRGAVNYVMNASKLIDVEKKESDKKSS